MYIEGGEPGILIHFQGPPPPLKRVFFVWTSFCKIKRLPKEVGSVPHTFSVFGFKSLFRKRWGGGFHTLILQGHGSLMLMEFSWGILRNSMTLLTTPPLKSKFAKLWEATYPPCVNTLIIPKFGGGGVRNLEGGGRRWSIMNVCTWGVSSSSMPHIHYTWRLSWEA